MNNNLSDRINKIVTTKAKHKQRDELLATDYQYPSFVKLSEVIEKMSDSFRTLGISHGVKLTNEYDQKHYHNDLIHIWGEGGVVYIQHFIFGGYIQDEYGNKYPRDQNDDDNDEVRPVSSGINLKFYYTSQYNSYGEVTGKPSRMETYYLHIDEDLTPLWGENDDESIATLIFTWLIDNIEKKYDL